MSRGSRIVINDDSSTDDSISSTSPRAPQSSVLRHRPIVCDDGLSDSSSSFEGYLQSLRIHSDDEMDSSDEENSPAGFFAALGESPPTEMDGTPKSCTMDPSTPTPEDEKDSLEAPWAYDKAEDEFYFRALRDDTIRWPNICIPGPLFQKLFSYQRVGVQWMAGLHGGRIGGLFGDDMGMGKTLTCLTYLGGLMKAGTIRNSLVVAPLSVLRSWEKEARNVLSACVPSAKIQVISSDYEKTRRARMIQEALECTISQPCLVICTYGLLRDSTSDFLGHDDASFWDYVILDEGHTIKNQNSQTSKCCRKVCSHPETRRLMLTGTPLMNRLEELWSVIDWTTSGKILGTLKRFKEYYAKPIEAARDKYATRAAMQLGERVNKELQELLAPFFLQRLKIDFLRDKLPEKTELVVWTHLSAKQRALYENFLGDGNSLLNSILSGENMTALTAITWSKKLCNHPMLVEDSNVFESYDNESMTKESVKLQILADLVDRLSSEGHRILVFSQSTKMLDIIQKVLAGVGVSRIDGQTKERDRQQLVDAFNDPNSSCDVMLLSTKAAGVGLTLVGADRVIVFDPSWTPAEDSQAVDRCYRIGQTREVVVYRLIAAGTVEEKMYDKQIHKDGIRRTVLTTGGSVERYFERNELSKLLKLSPPGVCETMEKVQDLEMDWSRYEVLLQHFGVVGLSRHDGFYQPSQMDGASQSAFPAVSTPALKVTGKVRHILEGPSRSQEAITFGRKEAARPSRSSSIDGQREDSGGKKKTSPLTENVGRRSSIVSAHRSSSFLPPDKDDSHGSEAYRDKENDDNVNSGEFSPTVFDKEPFATAIAAARLGDKINEPILEVLQRAKRAANAGLPKRALRMLMNVLDNRYDEVDRPFKLDFHQQIATLAGSLGMLEV